MKVVYWPMTVIWPLTRLTVTAESSLTTRPAA